jgi:hypothetical protein
VIGNVTKPQSVIQVNVDNVVADNDVIMGIANLSKPVVNIGALDSSTQSKAASATLNLGANVSLIGQSFAHGSGGILTNTSNGAGKYTTPTNTLNLSVNGSDDTGAASDTNLAATIVPHNPKMQLCDRAASWPVFPNVK